MRTLPHSKARETFNMCANVVIGPAAHRPRVLAPEDRHHLADRLAKLEHENAQPKKTLFGARSERIEDAAGEGCRAADARRGEGDASGASGGQAETNFAGRAQGP